MDDEAVRALRGLIKWERRDFDIAMGPFDVFLDREFEPTSFLLNGKITDL